MQIRPGAPHEARVHGRDEVLTGVDARSCERLLSGVPCASVAKLSSFLAAVAIGEGARRICPGFLSRGYGRLQPRQYTARQQPLKRLKHRPRRFIIISEHEDEIHLNAPSG